MATYIKPLRDQIAAASAELKLARRDGSAEWITKAAAALDALIDLIPTFCPTQPDRNCPMTVRKRLAVWLDVLAYRLDPTDSHAPIVTTVTLEPGPGLTDSLDDRYTDFERSLMAKRGQQHG